jgi:hypothetical protein
MNSVPKFCYQRKTDVPSGGWWCVCPTTDKVIKGGDFVDLVKRCSDYIISTGNVPPTDLEGLVEDALCQRMAGNENCVPCEQIKRQNVNFQSIVRWVMAMYNFAVNSKFQLVEQDEAERRAKICAACPYQVTTAGCWGCKGIAGMLPAIAGARKTSYDAQLKACGVCGCYNAVSVHLPLDVQKGEDLNFPDYCWKSLTQKQSA